MDVEGSGNDGVLEWKIAAKEIVKFRAGPFRVSSGSDAFASSTDGLNLHETDGKKDFDITLDFLPPFADPGLTNPDMN